MLDAFRASPAKPNAVTSHALLFLDLQRRRQLASWGLIFEIAVVMVDHTQKTLVWWEVKSVKKVCKSAKSVLNPCSLHALSPYFDIQFPCSSLSFMSTNSNQATSHDLESGRLIMRELLSGGITLSSYC